METYYPFAFLEGQEVTSWAGTEMALSADESGDLAENVVWESEAIPFLQFISLDLTLKDGSALRLLSQHEDGTGYHGLYLIGGFAQITEVGTTSPSGIYRSRLLTNLPTGIVRILSTRMDGPNATLEALVGVQDDVIRLLAAEVHETWTGELKIAEADESILVQLNGKRPAD